MRYTDTLIIDLDKPDLKLRTEDVLSQSGLNFITIPSGGKGFHYWIKFEPMPYKLIANYGSAGQVIKELGNHIRQLIIPDGKGIDIRGDGAMIIKLPGWDPFYEKYIIPEGCSTWDEVNDTLDAIPINPSCTIETTLKRHKPKKQKHTLSPSPNTIQNYPSMKSWLNTVPISEGSTNDLSFEFVKRCRLSNLPIETVELIAQEFYEQRTTEGTWGARANLNDWLGRVRSRARWWYANFEPHTFLNITIYESDIAWVRSISKYRKDPRFLLLHLIHARLSGGERYFLSMPRAAAHGISNGGFRSAIRRFADIIVTVKRGEKGTKIKTEKGIRSALATEFRMTIPLPEGQTVEWKTFDELVDMVEGKQTEWFTPSAQSGPSLSIQGHPVPVLALSLCSQLASHRASQRI
jgi:hypothetical protein